MPTSIANMKHFLKTLINIIGTAFVASFAAVVFTLFMNPIYGIIERKSGWELVGHSGPREELYLAAWVLFVIGLYFLVFRTKRKK